MTKEKRIEDLEDNRDIMINYLDVKVEEEDWHGVADAAMDLRDIDNQLIALNTSFEADDVDFDEDFWASSRGCS